MDENIFISWSKPRSLELAIAMRKIVPRVIQAAKPWLSKGGIESGQRWNQEIAQQLDGIEIGIVCLTPENLDERWINFESGALAKQLTAGARLCPYLLDLEAKDVGQPLSQFQASRANKEETFELIKSLNSVLGKTLDDELLKDTFEKFWPDLENDIKRIQAMPVESAPPKRETNDILDEMLKRIQAIEQHGTERLQDKPVDLGWSEVRQYLLSLSHKTGNEISNIEGAIQAGKNSLEDSNTPENYKARVVQAIQYRQFEIDDRQRLIKAITEMVRAKESCKTYFQ